MHQKSRRLSYVGPPTAEVIAAGVNGSVTGVIVTAGTAAQTATNASQVAVKDRVIIFALGAAAAGVGTTVLSATINGLPAFIDAQANTGGALAAIISARVPLIMEDRVFRLRAVLSASGATNIRADCFGASGLSSDRPVSAQSSTTAADTVRSVTLPIYTRGYIVACAMNDVTAANSCTWTGAPSNPTETTDSAIGTFLVSSSSRLIAAADNLAGSITATFAVSSSAGISLAAASFR